MQKPHAQKPFRLFCRCQKFPEKKKAFVGKNRVSCTGRWYSRRGDWAKKTLKGRLFARKQKGKGRPGGSVPGATCFPFEGGPQPEPAGEKKQGAPIVHTTPGGKAMPAGGKGPILGTRRGPSGGQTLKLPTGLDPWSPKDVRSLSPSTPGGDPFFPVSPRGGNRWAPSGPKNDAGWPPTGRWFDWPTCKKGEKKGFLTENPQSGGAPCGGGEFVMAKATGPGARGPPGGGDKVSGHGKILFFFHSPPVRGY